MTTFGRWWASASKADVHRRRGGRLWTYAAGHPALVLEVERYIRLDYAASYIVETLEVEGGKNLTWLDLRRALEPPGLPNSRRLVILRRPEGVRDSVWHEFSAWESSWGRRGRGGIIDAGKFIPSSVILVTGSELWNPNDVTDPRHRMFVHSDWGQYVECKPLSEEAMVRYIVGRFRRAGAGSQLAEADAEWLALRCGMDLLRIRSEVSKLLSILPPGVRLSQAIMEKVVTVSPGERFVEALIADRISEAIARAPYVTSLRFVLGALDYQLQACHLIRCVWGPVSRRGSTRTIADACNLDPFVVRKLRPFAARYDAQTVRSRYRLIVDAYRKIRSVPNDRPDWILVPLAARW